MSVLQHMQSAAGVVLGCLHWWYLWGSWLAVRTRGSYLPNTHCFSCFYCVWHTGWHKNAAHLSMSCFFVPPCGPSAIAEVLVRFWRRPWLTSKYANDTGYQVALQVRRLSVCQKTKYFAWWFNSAFMPWCDEVFIADFITNLLPSLSVKESGKLVNTWWSYR